MNEDQKIETALARRFARAAVPECPALAWNSMTPVPVRRRSRSRSFAYACATVIVLITGGVAAHASGALQAGYARLFPFGGSSQPIPPLIHSADRFTIAQAQQHMPFPIVVPAGLPSGTILRYAHVVSAYPVPRVSLVYQTHIGARYYQIIINETTAASGPALAHFEDEGKGKDGRTRYESWTLPLRRWNHGTIIMEMLPEGLPAVIVNRIVRENMR